ncbi:hypothetical protein LSH36_476g02031 [Paralvinella palmiformis]|uniref:Uncharacterized protein n=1 Tax=Paralvinella palmiformis TaxID=53620 RepID=A0AAD9MYI0_9ANNE|nr:hypothetical protein LSH36_476g02031 [Paralvinella palmiformis]
MAKINLKHVSVLNIHAPASIYDIDKSQIQHICTNTDWEQVKHQSGKLGKPSYGLETSTGGVPYNAINSWPLSDVDATTVNNSTDTHPYGTTRPSMLVATFRWVLSSCGQRCANVFSDKEPPQFYYLKRLLNKNAALIDGRNYRRRFRSNTRQWRPLRDESDPVSGDGVYSGSLNQLGRRLDLDSPFITSCRHVDLVTIPLSAAQHVHHTPVFESVWLVRGVAFDVGIRQSKGGTSQEADHPRLGLVDRLCVGVVYRRADRCAAGSDLRPGPERAAAWLVLKPQRRCETTNGTRSDRSGVVGRTFDTAASHLAAEKFPGHVTDENCGRLPNDPDEHTPAGYGHLDSSSSNSGGSGTSAISRRDCRCLSSEYWVVPSPAAATDSDALVVVCHSSELHRTILDFTDSPF